MPDLSLVDTKTGEITAPTFPDFWLLYPRRVARKDSERAWIKLTPAQQLQALIAIVEWRRVWADKDVDFIPHAATWLNGWRFEGEVPKAFTQSARRTNPLRCPKTALEPRFLSMYGISWPR